MIQQKVVDKPVRSFATAHTWRLQTAKKPETRMKRMESLLAMIKE